MTKYSLLGTYINRRIKESIRIMSTVFKDTKAQTFSLRLVDATLSETIPH